MAGALTAWIGVAVLFLAAAGALSVGGLLLFARNRDRGRTWLGARLIGSALLIGSLGALTVGGLGSPAGSAWQLAALTGALAGASLHLLDVPFALDRTRSSEMAGLPAWLAGLPLLVPVGFLVYASQRWPAGTLPADATPAGWPGWAGYDAVEDAAGFLTVGCILLGALAVSLLLVERALRARDGGRARARRMLAQAWLPVAGWAAAVGLVWLGLALQDPPAFSGFLLAQEILLDGPLAFSLAVVGPLLWGIDEGFGRRLTSGGQPSPRSNRS